MESNLQTSYMGLQLSSPFVVSSSGLTSTLQKVKACQDAGAAAVVLKSIFEEQMSAEAASLEQYHPYPEATDYLNGYVQQNALNEYIALIDRCSKECSIPIIASINCSTSGNWVEFARTIEQAGAAALELNIFLMPNDPTVSSSEIEARYLSVVEKVKKVISIPLSVKLPYKFSAPLNIIQQLYYRGVKGVTLFNRFYSPDIDIEKMRVENGNVMSSPEDLHNVLRWSALTSAGVPLIDIAASGGVHSGEAAIKAILSGACVVELCSVLYRNGVDYLPEIVAQFQRWIEHHNFTSIKDFRGKLNASHTKNAEIYERAQFMKYFSAKANSY